jgi:tetratricopeptide (TPR) repeat protein
MRRTLVTLTCLTLSATSFASGDFSEKDIDKSLSAAQRLIQQGKPDVAIHEKIDPIIEHFRALHSAPDEKVYSAHSMVETLIYSAMDSAAAKDSGKAPPGKVIVLTGAWSDALVLKGYALVELHKVEEAKAILKTAIALAPMNPAPWSELGNIYQNEKNWSEALDAYKQAESGAEMTEEEAGTRPMYTRALRGQAFVLTEQGRLDESEVLYRRCLTINPDDGGSKRELAYVAELRAKSGAAPANPPQTAAPPAAPQP